MDEKERIAALVRAVSGLTTAILMVRGMVMVIASTVHHDERSLKVQHDASVVAIHSAIDELNKLLAELQADKDAHADG
jgi:hypothetical protein